MLMGTVLGGWQMARAALIASQKMASGEGDACFCKKMVAAINKAGMIMDCSHMSLSSSLDVCEVSTKPVVFSHVNPRALSSHERTVTDAQIKASADTGGAIGISGVNRFLGVEGGARTG